MNQIHPDSETFSLLYDNEVSELTSVHIHAIHIPISFI